MLFKYIDTYERSMTINTISAKQMGAIKGKIFRRKSWGTRGDEPWYFKLYTPQSGPSYFAYCTKKGGLKLKTGYGYGNSDHEFSTVGRGVLKETDIVEVKKENRMRETINLSNVTVTVSECEKGKAENYKTAFENRNKWVGVWYSVNGDHIKMLPYASKKDIRAELKLHPNRTVVVYRMAKVLTVDFPIKEEEV